MQETADLGDAEGKSMSVMAGIVLIAASIVALFLSRPRDGVALPFLRVWIVGVIYAMAIMIVGLVGVALIIVRPF
jgi:hypothetical protein